MQDGGGDVGQDAVGAQTGLCELGRDEVERHGKGGVRREGLAGVVLDQLLGIAVVCCDQQATAYGERGFDDAPDARVNRFTPLMVAAISPV